MGAKSDGEVVVVAPVHEVEVIVVNDIGGVQDPLRHLGNVAGELPAAGLGLA